MFSWLCCKQNLEKRLILEQLLPKEYKYRISSFKVIEESEIKLETKFEASVGVNICDVENIKQFFNDFEQASSTNYNLFAGDKKNGGKNTLATGLRKCHHNVRKRKKSGQDEVVCDKIRGKQTNCPAVIHFKLKKTPVHVHDQECSLFPFEIKIEFVHNHSIESANAVKYHEVRKETKNKFFELFGEGHSAASAYHDYKNHLMAKYGDNFVTVSADRAIMPDKKWVANYHAVYMQEAFGKINSPEAYEKAVEKVQEYNKKHGEELCVIKQMEGVTIVAVCDKLSKRVHNELPQAGDIIYVDATSNLDRQDSKLIKFMTCSPAGGLPLGFVITPSEGEDVLQAAFETFKEVLPEEAFNKRGKDEGPVLFMTDDADAEINALHTVWPNAKLLLCTWHVLNALWRWLWDRKHEITKEDRPHLLKMFCALLYAKTETEYDIKKEILLCDETCLKYPNYIKHLEKSYFKRKESWAISVRNDKKLPTHSTNTSNYIESSFRITKDKQFNRTKAFNLAELLDVVLDDSAYYIKRLLDIGNGRLGAFQHSKSRYVLKVTTTIKENQITELGDSKFIVESQSNPEVIYQVDMVSGFCDCKSGMNCGPCKHKDAISKYFKIAEFSVLPECDANMRAMYHYIAEGIVCDNTWYRDLETPSTVPDIASFVKNRTEGNVKSSHEENIQRDSVNDLNLLPDDDSSSNESAPEIDDTEETLNQFASVMDQFKNKVISSYKGTLKKGVKYFTKKLQKFCKNNESTLEKSLFSIGKELSNPKTAGKKRKIGKLIPIQVTAKSRGQYKHRGRTLGVSGRRTKDQEDRVQMVVRDDDENVLHSLPKQKKVKHKQKHSLKHSVETNNPSAKKH